MPVKFLNLVDFFYVARDPYKLEDMLAFQLWDEDRFCLIPSLSNWAPTLTEDGLRQNVTTGVSSALTPMLQLFFPFT